MVETNMEKVANLHELEAHKEKEESGRKSYARQKWIKRDWSFT